MSIRNRFVFGIAIVLLLFPDVHNASELNYDSEIDLEEEFFGENDFFEVFFIKSLPRSMTTAYENAFTVKTSGLLIRNAKTLDIITLEFLPANWNQCLFPTIQILDDNSPGHVTWNKRGQLVKSSIFHSANYEEALYLGTMNGAVRSTFLDWVTEEYIMKSQTFSPQSVCVYDTASFNPANETCPIKLRNWDSFVIRSLEMLSKYDVKLSTVLPMSGERITIQCASVSDKMLYHTKLPAYYHSFYTCMEAHSSLSYINAINTCATSAVNKQDGFNFINVGTNHYIRCGLGKSRQTSGMFATETYYLLPIPAPAEPSSYEADGSIYDVVVAVAIVVFLIFGVCAVLGEGYYASKKRIELLMPQERQRVMSTSDHMEGMMDELDSTEHGGVGMSERTMSNDFSSTKSMSMEVSVGEVGKVEEGGGQLLKNMLNKVKSQRSGGGSGSVSGGRSAYTSLTTADDDEGHV